MTEGGRRIVIEHGGLHNLGDIAMLQNVARKLRAEMPDVSFFVRGAAAGDFVALGEHGRAFDGLRHYRRIRHFRERWLRYVPRAVGDWIAGALVGLMTFRLLLAARLARRTKRLWLCPHQSRSFFRVMKDSDLLYVAGNGGMTDDFLYGGLYPFCAESLVAHELGKPVIFSGQGIGPIASSPGRRFLRRALRQAEFVSVRDEESLRTAGALGLSGPKIARTGDDADDLPVEAEAIAAAREELAGAFATPPRLLVAVNLRWAGYAGLAEEDLDLPLRLCRVLAGLPNAAVAFVPILRKESADLDRYRALLGRLGPAFRGHAVATALHSPTRTKAIVAAADLAVGFSYHFLVFALSSGVPAVGLHRSPYYRQKVKGILEIYGAPENEIDLCQPDWEGRLARRAVSLLEDREPVRARLLQRREALRASIEEPIQVAARLLGAGRGSV